jgi:hypothetical protein
VLHPAATLTEPVCECLCVCVCVCVCAYIQVCQSGVPLNFYGTSLCQCAESSPLILSSQAVLHIPCRACTGLRLTVCVGASNHIFFTKSCDVLFTTVFSVPFYERGYLTHKWWNPSSHNQPASVIQLPFKLIHVHAVKYAAKLIHTRRALSNAIITLIRSQCQAKPAILLITIDLFRYTFVFLLACGGGKLQCSVGTRLAPSACLDDRGVLFSLRCCELWCRGRLKTGRLKKWGIAFFTFMCELWCRERLKIGRL